MAEKPIAHALTPQLESMILGGEIDEGGFFAEVGEEPRGFRLRDLFERLGKPIPPRLAELNRVYELWLIPHRVNIIRRSGLAEPTSVGIEVRYLKGKKTCSVVSLLPSFQYLVHGRLGGNIELRGTS